MSAAPFDGSTSTWKKSRSVRSPGGLPMSQFSPLTQIDPWWIEWSLALKAAQLRPPSIVWAR